MRCITSSNWNGLGISEMPNADPTHSASRPRMLRQKPADSDERDSALGQSAAASAEKSEGSHQMALARARNLAGELLGEIERNTTLSLNDFEVFILSPSAC